MLKKLILIVILLPSFSYAKFPEFEPSVICGLASVAGYAVAPSGSEMTYAGLACAAGYMAGSYMGDYYKNKYGKDYEEKFRKFEEVANNMNKATAEAAMNQKEGGYYRVKTRVIKGTKLPNGAVRAPTLETYLEEPASETDVRVGN